MTARVRVSATPPAAGSRSSLLRDAEGRAGGYLEILPDGDDDEGSAKVDSAALSDTGPPGWLSLSWGDADGIPFDDVAVSAALRSCLRHGQFGFVSTLTRRDDTIVGAVVGVSGGTARLAAVALRDDPFSRLFPRRLVSYGPGLFGASSPPAGPCIQRYGSATPWPHDRF